MTITKTLAITGIAIVVFTLVPAARAQQACPCVPLTPLWTVKTCDTWDCAMAELVVANGDPYVFPVSTGDGGHPWVVMRRIVSGTGVDVPDPTYEVATFDTFDGATSRFLALANDARPMFLSAPDGKLLVVSLRPDAVIKRRSVHH